jgi:hypothetical protein
MTREVASVTDLAAELRDLPAVRGRFPWPDHEYVKGWGVFVLPFDSGHVLALRVFPENDFGPYRSLWHRDPAGRWSIHVDGARLDTACPRYYGAACARTDFTHIELTWTGPRALKVVMDAPPLRWSLVARETPALQILNPISASLPIATWRPRPLVRARELLARTLGMGDIRLSGTMPSGHTGTLMPQRMYLIERSTAVLEGVDLGAPAHLKQNPKMGEIPLPSRGVLAIGQAAWRIADLAEYERTRAETAPAG